MRITELDWLPIEFAQRDIVAGSTQVVLLFKPYEHGQCYLEYSTSNPDYVLANAAKHGYTEFAVISD